jgi:hypothetical protein
MGPAACPRLAAVLRLLAPPLSPGELVRSVVIPVLGTGTGSMRHNSRDEPGHSWMAVPSTAMTVCGGTGGVSGSRSGPQAAGAPAFLTRSLRENSLTSSSSRCSARAPDRCAMIPRGELRHSWMAVPSTAMTVCGGTGGVSASRSRPQAVGAPTFLTRSFRENSLTSSSSRCSARAPDRCAMIPRAS